MSDNQFFTGSLCLDDIVAALQKNHSSFSKSSKNQKTYVSIKMWVNEEPDQYGNSVSVQLNSDQSASPDEKALKFYIGNLKRQKTGGESLSSTDVANKAGAITNLTQNVPIKETGAAGNGAATGAVNAPGAGAIPGMPADGLPF